MWYNDDDGDGMLTHGIKIKKLEVTKTNKSSAVAEMAAQCCTSRILASSKGATL